METTQFKSIERAMAESDLAALLTPEGRFVLALKDAANEKLPQEARDHERLMANSLATAIAMEKLYGKNFYEIKVKIDWTKVNKEKSLTLEKMRTTDKDSAVREAINKVFPQIPLNQLGR